MRRRELSCPVCQADLPLSGEERVGEDVYCPYCGAPCRIVAGDGEDELELEEDF
jgi:predicted amidophosphoribosyltransferase